MLLITCKQINEGLLDHTPTTHPWFKINQNGTGNIVLIVSLVEEYIFTVASFRCPFLENTILAYTMFSTQPLPEDRTHLGCLIRASFSYACRHTLVSALPKLNSDNFTRHSRVQVVDDTGHNLVFAVQMSQLVHNYLTAEEQWKWKLVVQYSMQFNRPR